MINEKFNVDTIDSNLWLTGYNSGTSVYVSGGKLWIYQSGGWSGGFFRTKSGYTYSSVKNYFYAEFDIQVVGNYRQNGASVLPCFGFVGASATRDTAYYYSATSNNLFFELASNTSINIGVRNNLDTNSTIYATCTGLNLSVATHIQVVVDNNNIKLFINRSTIPAIDYTLPDTVFSNLTNDVRFEFFLGNYQSGQYMTVDNIILDNTRKKHLIVGNDLIKTYNGTSLSTIAHSLPTLITDYSGYGIINLNIFNKSALDSVFNETNNKFKVRFTKLP
jgi:hypothetical protein